MTAQAVPLTTTDDDGDKVHSGRMPSRGILITFATVLALVTATGLTLLGLGTPNNNVSNFDASSWLFSAGRGEVDHVNGVTARVDTRANVPQSQNHEIALVQTDKNVIVRDLSTGQVSTLDLTTLQITGNMATTPGIGVNVVLQGTTAFVIDSVQGQVRQLDPRTLAPVGDSITLPNGLAPGGFDGKGVLWIGVPTEGTVVAIAAGAAGATGPAGGPKVTRTVSVAPPGHDLALTALDDGVAVLDNTDQVLKKVPGDANAAIAVTDVPIDGPAAMPSRSSGGEVAITETDQRRVVVMGTPKVVDFTVPGRGPLSPAVTFAGRVYCADSAAGIVYEFDTSGKLLNQIAIPAAGGPIELEVRESHLFINAPSGSTARVVNENHEVKEVNKYQDGVPGADPPPPPPASTQPAEAVPGKPQSVAAAAGDSSIRITWKKAPDGGAPITKYVVEGAGQTITVGAKQRSVDITGLTNGQTYTFTVRAVNKVGSGPKASTGPVMPTADVPAAPASLTAKANPDGTITLTWPAANGLGRKIVRYTVTASSNGAQSPAGDVAAPGMTLAAGSYPYGVQVAFTVVAVNDKGAGSAASPVSNVVVPFTHPDAPGGLRVVADATQKGAVQAAWNAAKENGRPVKKYIVDANGKTQDVTGTSVTLTGFGDDEAVTVKVRAVNEAGEGPQSSASARTIGKPDLTVTGTTHDYTSISVAVTPNSKGGQATCTLQVNGAGTANAACGTAPVTLKVGGLAPNNTYTFTVSITSPAGASTATGSSPTNTLRATVICTQGNCTPGIWSYRGTNQTSGQAVNEYFNGQTFTPQCHLTGQNINATPWGGRQSNEWLRIANNEYFPFAFANTDGGNNLSLLPGC